METQLNFDFGDKTHLQDVIFKVKEVIRTHGDYGDYYIRSYKYAAKKKDRTDPVVVEQLWFCNRIFSGPEVDWTDFFKVTEEEADAIISGKLAVRW